MKIDRVATAAQHYKDQKSYRTLDGREVLVGLDWQQRKWELFWRCKGRCEYMITDEVRCAREANDAHHKTPRSKGRNDKLSNLQAICRHHHRAIDKRQPRWTPKEVTA